MVFRLYLILIVTLAAREETRTDMLRLGRKNPEIGQFMQMLNVGVFSHRRSMHSFRRCHDRCE